jgi:hypothetical protein
MFIFLLKLLVAAVVAIATLTYFCWERFEEVVRVQVELAASKELGVKVSLENIKLRLLHGLVEVRGLTVANGPGDWKAPHFLSLRQVNVRARGPLTLASLPGLVRFGPQGEWAAGSLVRHLEEVTVEGLHGFLEEETTTEKEATSSNPLALLKNKLAAATGQTKQKAGHNAGFITKLAAKAAKKKADQRAKAIATRRAFVQKWAVQSEVGGGGGGGGGQGLDLEEDGDDSEDGGSGGGSILDEAVAAIIGSGHRTNGDAEENDEVDENDDGDEDGDDNTDGEKRTKRGNGVDEPCFALKNVETMSCLYYVDFIACAFFFFFFFFFF